MNTKPAIESDLFLKCDHLRCSTCNKANMVFKSVSFPVWYQGRQIIYSNVPALVCRNDGHRLYDLSVLKKLIEFSEYIVTSNLKYTHFDASEFF